MSETTLNRDFWKPLLSREAMVIIFISGICHICLYLTGMCLKGSLFTKLNLCFQLCVNLSSETCCHVWFWSSPSLAQIWRCPCRHFSWASFADDFKGICFYWIDCCKTLSPISPAATHHSLSLPFSLRPLHHWRQYYLAPVTSKSTTL